MNIKIDDLYNAVRVTPGKKIKLADYDPGWAITKEVKQLGKLQAKQRAQEFLSTSLKDLAAAQNLLYAADTWSVLVIFQALDAAGKDSTIKHVMSGVNPQGCQVFSFKQPSREELDHNFLWRCMRALPERGRIGIFNRSYYEEVLVVRVHEELLAHERLPATTSTGKKLWKERYEDINNFELHLTRNGTKVLKFYLNVSKEEQKRRFLERLDDPEKHWKFSVADVRERQHWNDYRRAYDDAINATSTPWAPWHIIPADHKWVTRAVVAAILNDTIRSLGLGFPVVPADQKLGLDEARRMLESE